MLLLGPHLLFSIALASASSFGDGPPDAAKGASLLRGCQAELRLMGLDSLENAPAMDLINGAYCIGYVNGFTAGLPDVSLRICTRADSMGGLVRAYVHYMGHNPRLLEEDKRVGLRQALEQAYPCPAVRDSKDGPS